MNAQEIKEFEQLAYYQQAIKLRKWDDQAKIVGKAIPAIEALYLRHSRGYY
ncbi:MAG: hypothetical protein HC880_10410 [Bacteroidia bacterium]|nr:hypothetical protein [Bacteroidia bacterium]